VSLYKGPKFSTAFHSTSKPLDHLYSDPDLTPGMDESPLKIEFTAAQQMDESPLTKKITQTGSITFFDCM